MIAHPRHETDDFPFVHQPTGKVTSIRTRPIVSTPALGLAAFIAAEGAGIGIVPSIVVGSDLDSGRLVRVLPNHAIPSITLYLRLRRTRHLPAKVASFRDHVRWYVRQFAS